jgi:small subunit ribosomal protein S16
LIFSFLLLPLHPARTGELAFLYNFMATKLRLQRHGRKKQAYYYIVAADSRAPRDGRFIERIGDYNPNSNPATINLDLKKAVKWLDTGAVPTDTVRAILSYKGAMMLHHLHGGVNKGAFTAEEADAKFAKWTEEKEAKVQSKRDSLANAKAQTASERLKAEAKIKEARAAAIAAKNAVVEEVPAEEVEAPVVEDSVETPAVEATEAIEATSSDAPEAAAENTEA